MRDGGQGGACAFKGAGAGQSSGEVRVRHHRHRRRPRGLRRRHPRRAAQEDASSASRRKTSAAPASTGAASPPRPCSKTARSSASCAPRPPSTASPFDEPEDRFRQAHRPQPRHRRQALRRASRILFNKYDVKHEIGTGQLLGPHRVQITGKDGTKEVTAEHVIIAVGRQGHAAAVRAVRRQAGHHQRARR